VFDSDTEQQQYYEATAAPLVRAREGPAQGGWAKCIEASASKNMQALFRLLVLPLPVRHKLIATAGEHEEAALVLR